MTDIYDRAKATAARQLAPRSSGGKGMPIALTLDEEGEYDPATQSAPITSTVHQGSGLRDSYAIRDIDGTLIRADDVRFIVSPVLLDGTDAPNLTTAYKLTAGGVTYSIVNVKPWDYAGLVVGFEVQARR